MLLKKTIFYVLNCAVIAILLSAGVLLFFLRAQNLPKNETNEIVIAAKPTGQIIVDNQFLILISKKDVKFLEEILRQLNLRIKTPILNWILVELDEDRTPAYRDINSNESEHARNIISALLQNPKILDAQHNFALSPAILPTNKNFSHEWHLQVNSKKYPSSMQMPLAWEISQGSPDISIAVIDDFSYKKTFTFHDRFSSCASRIDFHQPFAPLSIVHEENSIPHGEIILLALGACANIEPFSTGIDWHSKLIAVQRPALGHAQSFLAALYASNIDVCEQSIVKCPTKMAQAALGTKPDILLLPFSADAPDLLQFTSDMLFAIAKQNIIVVGAAGNDQMTGNNFFPGGAPGLINVGSLNKNGQRASFTNWGPSLDIFAPGEHIEFFYTNGRKIASGTSLSAAFVAGTISLMKAVNPELNYKTAQYFLHRTASEISCENYCRKNLINKTDVKCEELCCLGDNFTCGKFALNVHDALMMAKNKTLNSPLIGLSRYYQVYLRDNEEERPVLLSNFGDLGANISTISYDKNILVSPSEFALNSGDSQEITISFKKEPFKRQIFKVEFIAKIDGKILDRIQYYLEYIPKK